MAAMEDERSRLMARQAESDRLIALMWEDSIQLRNRIDKLMAEKQSLLSEILSMRHDMDEMQKRLLDALNNLAGQRAARFASRSQKGKGNRTPDRSSDTDTTHPHPERSTSERPFASRRKGGNLTELLK